MPFCRQLIDQLDGQLTLVALEARLDDGPQILSMRIDRPGLRRFLDKEKRESEGLRCRGRTRHQAVEDHVFGAGEYPFPREAKEFAVGPSLLEHARRVE